MSEWIIGVLTLVISLLLTLLFVGFGWYLIWKYLLSRFWFVRVLFGYSVESEGEKSTPKINKTRPKRLRTIN
ncbi:hypothetical protein Phum_PHUM232240 [Pediculus humanus corporis]|uniref:Small integral membrane protein 13 n=1 Tax=Pediculus humanus subsp. corporis TaxID=121224 RepID=E0VIS5_PEDHC|nr:uncharacterized protein Phum_PHUM232240 [Pediculus humanus corporis]EEB13281.1 hypothetical protein Phum_PHUM232240 [Pediculus humanus corporis]